MSGRFDDAVLEKYKQASSPFDHEPTFKECLDYYLAVRIKQYLAPNTYTNYRSIAYTHILPTIGGYSLKELDTTILQYYVHMKAENGRVDEGGGLSSKTIQEHRNFLNGFFKQLIEWGIVSHNPCSGVKIPKTERKEVKALTIKDQTKLRETISPVFQKGSLLPIRIAMLLGLRIGEVCALRLEDINLSLRLLTIDESLNRVAIVEDDQLHYGLHFGTTKSKKTRIIPLHEEAYALLKEYVDTMPEKYKQDQKQVLFMNTKGSYLEPRLLNYHFKKLCREQNIENTHFHALRHTFATNALEANIEITTLSKILGHANTTITQNIYVHVTQRQMEREMAKLNLLSMLPHTPITASY